MRAFRYSFLPAFVLPALLGLPILLGFTLPAPARAAPARAPPEAREVVVRGRTRLADAIAAAFGGGANTARGPAAIVLDVTPHTRGALGQLREAFGALRDHAALPSRWRIARLGDPFSPALSTPDRLAALLPVLLKRDTAERDTVGALRRSLKSLKERGGTLLYLADWRFEDEHDLEALVRDLAGKEMRFGVVGSEAAFGRAWNDGVADPRDRFANGFSIESMSDVKKLYDESIGRRPFGPFDRKAPWRGGDSAYPHAPYRWSQRLWTTEFRPSELSFRGSDGCDLRALAADGSMEDLLERLGRGPKVSSSGGSRRFPLPSGFGPHGLMRAAAVRGGRYVLWSWNPEHRVSIRYDYARVNRYGPDLRSRADVRRNVPHQPAAVALLKAWDRIGDKLDAVAAHTAPLGPGGSGPRSIDLIERSAVTLPMVWPYRDQHRDFLRKAGHWKAAAKEGIEILERGIARAGEPKDSPSRRYKADAELMRHVLQVLHFELAEAIAVASDLPDDVWKDDERYPGLVPEIWILRGDDPEDIRTTDVQLRDAKAGERVRDARREHLRRYRGTPFGLQVAGNTVETWQLRMLPKLKGTPPTGLPGRTPAESGGKQPKTPRTPGGPSGGGGPTTGR